MAKLPDAPSPRELGKTPPELATLPNGTRIARIYFHGGPFPSAWTSFRDHGPLLARFDPHEPPPRKQSRATLYGALSVVTCLAEIFQQTRIIERAVDAPWLTIFAIRRPIVLLDLTGAWPTRAGASMAIHSGPRPRARGWARAIYEAYPAVEGLLYCSSMDANRPAVALFERAVSSMPARPAFNRALSDPGLQARIAVSARRLGYAIR